MTTDSDITLITTGLLNEQTVCVERESKEDLKLTECFSRQVSIKEDVEGQHKSTNIQAQLVVDGIVDQTNTVEEFLLQVATIPGTLAGKFDFERSQLLQKQLFDKILQDDNGEYRISILVRFNIDHKVVLWDSFSETESWGLEPNFYIIVKGTYDVASGAAALLGAILGQDAIGICSHLTADDLNTWKSSQGRTIPDGVHRLVTVRLQQKTTSMTPTMALQMIEHVREKFDSLSAQLDIFGHSIEFHEYDSCIEDLSGAAIKQILEEKFSYSFKTTESLGRRSLLEANEYESTLSKSGICPGHIISCIEVTRQHAFLFSPQ